MDSENSVLFFFVTGKVIPFNLSLYMSVYIVFPYISVGWKSAVFGTFWKVRIYASIQIVKYEMLNLWKQWNKMPVIVDHCPYGWYIVIVLHCTVQWSSVKCQLFQKTVMSFVV